MLNIVKLIGFSSELLVILDLICLLISLIKDNETTDRIFWNMHCITTLFVFTFALIVIICGIGGLLWIKI